MRQQELSQVVAAARCRVVGWEDAGNDSHRLVLALLVRAFDQSESAVLCEPSLARTSARPPDVVLIDPETGVHVVEVKGVPLGMVESLAVGGEFHVRYRTGTEAKNPLAQARRAMFDVKDATRLVLGREVRVPFRYWVALPRISRGQWMGRFGADAFCPPEFLFREDLHDPDLAFRMGAASRRANPREPVRLCPLDELQCVWRAFGDTSVLYATPQERPPRRVEAETLGERFDEAADAYKGLSDEQQRLSTQNWDGGPRLVRGVAGSGKTVVLANNLARRLARAVGRDGEWFDQPSSPPSPPLHRPQRLLAVCHNQTLVPYLRRKADAAYRQRTGRPLPARAVDLFHFNGLLWHLDRRGLWRYQKFDPDDAKHAQQIAQYLRDLAHVKQHVPATFDALAYDAVYVDEGQDLHEEDFRLLKELCRVEDGGEPNLYVFYDDAQNLYGRRPNWQSLGLNVRGGRSTVMIECFRTTRPVVEAAFNVLYGSCAPAGSKVPTREFGDLATLEQKGLIGQAGGVWRVRFARREGPRPTLTVVSGPAAREDEHVVARVRWLVEEQRVRPEDVLVLTHRRTRAEALAAAVRAAALPSVAGVHVAFAHKDQPLTQRGRVTFSTVASAKGYDAFCVLLASADDFPADVGGRASFYVGCTRAVEYLELSARSRQGLVAESEAALKALDAGGPRQD